MDLREFVHGALKDVVLGIQDAQREQGVTFRAKIISTVMKFDVAVTAERGKKGGGSAGVRIAVVEAKLGGEAQFKDTTVSRIQFAVPVLMPPNPQSWGQEGGRIVKVFSERPDENGIE
jgi:hypothetical protein